MSHSGRRAPATVPHPRLSRRGLITGALAAAAGLVAPRPTMPRAAAQGAPSVLGYAGVPVSVADSVVVPAGYTANVVSAWGDPVSNSLARSLLPSFP